MNRFKQEIKTFYGQILRAKDADEVPMVLVRKFSKIENFNFFFRLNGCRLVIKKIWKHK